MATIAGAKSPHLWPTPERSWRMQFYGEVHRARAAAADREAT
jgi:hypothetical protein